MSTSQTASAGQGDSRLRTPAVQPPNTDHRAPEWAGADRSEIRRPAADAGLKFDTGGPPYLILEIDRGRTRFPHRPVSNRRFLIGRGPQCDLQIAGDGMPALHSLLLVEPSGEISLEAVAQRPALRVNGQTVTEAALSAGDRVDVGPIGFVVRMVRAGGPTSRSVPPEACPSSHGEDEEERAVEDLSVLELVERLQRDEALVARFEDGIRGGVEAFQEAIANASGRTQDPPPSVLHSPPPNETPERAIEEDELDGQLIHELERILLQLASFSQQLEDRCELLSHREAKQLEAASTLLDSQQKLAAQLESLAEQVAALDGHLNRPRRAIA